MKQAKGIRCASYFTSPAKVGQDELEAKMLLKIGSFLVGCAGIVAAIANAVGASGMIAPDLTVVAFYGIGGFVLVLCGIFG